MWREKYRTLFREDSIIEVDTIGAKKAERLCENLCRFNITILEMTSREEGKVKVRLDKEGLVTLPAEEQAEIYALITDAARVTE